MENFLGEIRIFAGTFAPLDWAFCQGQLLQISENDALFTLLGTTYGGDGQTTFGLPNLASRVVVGQGTGPGRSPYPIGATAGVEGVNLTANQMALHQHPLSGTVSVLTGGTGQASPNGAYFGDQGGNAYDPTPSGIALAPGSLTGQTDVAGGGLPHSNIQPVLATNYIIALTGIYPSQS
ncbi:phage tail protein [Hymenobacter terricola]|uniref:phage tail protein n=1 Tax=Hymenobacter terricola TaxID=2819236 RepID=UPI001B311C49|nr:tail fiber protein [Hymenobacter terricola]